MYDGDARVMTSRDVVDGVGGEDGGEGDEGRDHRFGSVRSFGMPPVTPVGREMEVEVRPSVLRSLEWLKPILEQ